MSDYLKTTSITPARLITKWYGETQPVTDNATPQNKALNRRVEFVITANEKMKAEAKAEAEKNQ